MKLGAHHAAAQGGGADAAPAVGAVGQPVGFVLGLGLVAVHKIAFAPGGHILQHRARKAAVGGHKGAPANVGHTLGHTAGIHGGNALHTPGNQPKALVPPKFIAFVKQHLHAKANAQKRRALGGFLPDRLDQPQGGKAVHAVLKSAHAGQNQPRCGQHGLGGLHKFHLRAAIFGGAPHAQQIAEAVVDNAHFHKRTSTPPARISCFSSGTVALP